MAKKINKQLCCALCALVSLFSASQKTESISFRDICRKSAKGTTVFFKHGCSWVAFVGLVVGYKPLLVEGIIKTNGHSTMEKKCLSASYACLVMLTFLNTCDMIYEYKESKSDKNEKPTSNNHREFDTAKAQDKKGSPYLQ